MWWLFQVLIMTLIIASNGAYLWAPQNDQPRLTIAAADHKRRGSDEDRCFFACFASLSIVWNFATEPVAEFWLASD